ncbi:MAG: putative transport system ATP-binding protein [Candidatus Dependentiae bacterium]|nr:putative transport system ATP-binding protein [Candidatus Dependentiae bacterium]
MRTTISKYDLSLQHVTKGFEIDQAVRPVFLDLDYTFTPGVSYAIVGASGSGKSTLLHVIAGFESADAGAVLWGGREVAHFSTAERETWVSRHIGFAFQYHYLIPELSVYDNVYVSALLTERTVGRREIEELLLALGLHEHAGHYPHQLSGGQQQRAALARALIRRPTYLIADEPTGSLDAKTGGEIIDFCLSYQKTHGMGLIIATHDQAVYEKMDVVLRLEGGVLRES